MDQVKNGHYMCQINRIHIISVDWYNSIL